MSKTLFRRLAHWLLIIQPFLLRYRRPLIVTLHAGLAALAQYLAFWLRFDGAIPEQELALLTRMLPWLVAIKGLTFIPFRLYVGLWRYTGIWDLRDIMAGVLTSSFLSYVLIHWGFGLEAYPRSVFIIDAILLIFLLGGLRLTRRIYGSLGHLKGGRRVLIYGAGDMGEMVIRDMKNHAAVYRYDPIGFIDDDRAKVGRRIHGVPLLGTSKNFPTILATERP